MDKHNISANNYIHENKVNYTITGNLVGSTVLYDVDKLNSLLDTYCTGRSAGPPPFTLKCSYYIINNDNVEFYNYEDELICTKSYNGNFKKI